MDDRRFDAAAAERILRRAIELDDARHPEPYGGVSETALREAAEELGVGADTVLRAAAEERAGMLAGQPRRTDRLVGPAAVTAARVIDRPRIDVLESADEWLRRASFRRLRHTPGLAEYARRNDPVAAAQRAVRAVGGREQLGQVKRLRVIAEPLGADSTLLAFVVGLESQRTATLAGSSTLAGSGVVSASFFAATSTPWLWLGVPASVGAGLGLMRARIVGLRDVQTALDGALDQLAAGTTPPRALAGVSTLLREANRLRRYA